MKLREIPEWAEQYIPLITDGAFETIEELKEFELKAKSWQVASIVGLNIQIDLLEKLNNNDLLRTIDN